MSEVAALIRESVSSLLERHCPTESLGPSERAGWAAALWAELERAGMTRIAVDESHGGGGGDVEDAAVVVRAAAKYCAAVPVAETSLLAGWLLAEAGLRVPQGPLTAAVLRDGQRIDGVPYARQAAAIAVLAPNGAGWGVALLEPRDYTLDPGVNLAGEPRDSLKIPRLPGLAPCAADPAAFRARGALARSIQLAGAMERVLELTVRYAAEREQFGSPLNRFQAVQHLLTTLAEETYAAGATVDAAVAMPGERHVAIAKIRASEAAGLAAAAAHQVHGAIGLTVEHPLHHSTRRLWSWRDEFGTEASWSIRLWELACAQDDPADIWRLVTRED